MRMAYADSYRRDHAASEWQQKFLDHMNEAHADNHGWTIIELSYCGTTYCTFYVDFIFIFACLHIVKYFNEGQ